MKFSTYLYMTSYTNTKKNYKHCVHIYIYSACFPVCLIMKKTGTRRRIYKTGKIHQRRKPGECTSFCVIELDCTRLNKYYNFKQTPSPKTTETC